MKQCAYAVSPSLRLDLRSLVSREDNDQGFWITFAGCLHHGKSTHIVQPGETHISDQDRVRATFQESLCLFNVLSAVNHAAVLREVLA